MQRVAMQREILIKNIICKRLECLLRNYKQNKMVVIKILTSACKYIQMIA